jgi:hypothetical protein
MRKFRVIFTDETGHILAIKTVSCATVGMAVSIACDMLDNEGLYLILNAARNLKVEIQP